MNRIGPEQVAAALTIDLKRAAARSDDIPATWSDEDVERAAQRYVKFLCLAAGHPRGPLAPTEDIDRMWHLHMLSPVAYVRDCMRLFGAVLDHAGGFGKDPNEEEALGHAFKRTARLWQEAFDEPYVASEGEMRDCWHDCQSRCWHACRSVWIEGDLLFNQPAVA